MIGNLANAFAIILGSIIGIFLKDRFKENYKDIIMNGIGLSVLVIGISGAIKTENMLLVVISLVVGSIIGEWLKIENKLQNIGNIIESKVGAGTSNISNGFVTASLIYCVGAMAIVGALESGLTGNNQTLFIKSILDGVTSIIFASTLGIGVAFSSLSVLVYQGLITLTANTMKIFLTEGVITEMSAVGGILIMGIGINLLGLKKIKIGNMLPSIFIPIIYFIFTLVINRLF
ncbi:hypothetical protein SAMN05660462_02608 [Proteiniborus ethanoligenes]|uniref:DUF554 domain-containing protein n=1 Tax=Proteiniborus ethanoligenes TaxID=415015 RepID=A0A1H3RXM4_9FIRM|nr:DUF554 domain-containing protein [Proteiniborus ethanoligenes]SDZ30360.1 hypothetical protein SAMN05660462_02608 [Proteiniborus ethanoligenes]